MKRPGWPLRQPGRFFLVTGLLQNGHSTYILQGNLFHDFLEEWISVLDFRALRFKREKP
jgi:hypothetical protein